VLKGLKISLRISVWLELLRIFGKHLQYLLTAFRLIHPSVSSWLIVARDFQNKADSP
jgi:hypothetical protein